MMMEWYMYKLNQKSRKIVETKQLFGKNYIFLSKKKTSLF